MRTRNLLPKMASLLLPAVAFGAAAWTPAADGDNVGGTFTAAYVNRNAQEVPDAPGHAIGLALSQGTNRSTGASEFMSGGKVVNAETSDLVRGTGTHQGYITFTRGPDTTISRWNGKVTTTLGADQRPATSFDGTWTVVRGTGRYVSATGRGRYKGRMTSEKGYVIDWTGEISGVKVAAR